MQLKNAGWMGIDETTYEGTTWVFKGMNTVQYTYTCTAMVDIM